MILYAMLYAVAVGLPIFLAAVVSSAFLRRHGRAERGVWLAALILALTVPVIALTRPAEGPSAAPVSAPVVETGLIGLPAALAVPEATVVTVPVASAAVGLDEILIGLWLFASLVLVLRWAVAATQLARLTRSCPVEAVDGVRVSLTSNLGPAVAGWVRPRILVPAWLMSIPQPQRSLVLLHEEEHVRARDPLLILVSRVARILTPWNPLVWILSSRLLRAVELDCDRRVLRRRPDVEAYGTTLLTVSARDPGTLLSAAAFAEAEAPLRRRILAMTTPPSTVSVLGLVTALVLGILLLLGVFEVPIPTMRPVEEAASADVVGRAWTGETAETVRALEASLSAQAEALARQEVTAGRVANLEAQLRRLEASQVEATLRAERAEALLDELARARSDAAERPQDGSADDAVSTSAILTSTITGTIKDVVTDRPLEKVQVFLRGTGIGSLTNSRGRFLLLNVPVGDQEVVAHRVGYGEETQSVTAVEGGPVNVDFELREIAVELDALLVTGQPSHPGGPPGAGWGRDGASPLIYIDGVRVAGPGPSNLEDLLRPEEIDRIEIVKPDAAVELYGEEARGGAVLIYLHSKQAQQEEARPILDARPILQGAPVRPTFTPFTVEPRILNVDEVQTAMREAYPPELRAEGIGGTVEVYFFITEEGIVHDTRINGSSGHQALDDAALRVADVYRFSPALNRDERVAVWVAFPITFLPAG